MTLRLLHFVCNDGCKVISKNLVFILLLAPILSISQSKEEEKTKVIENRIEYLVEDTEESNVDYTNLFDQLSHYYDHPLNINRADLNDLEGLGMLNSIQVNNLLVHIEKNGKLMALEELQTVEGFDLDAIKLLIPFIKISSDVDDAQLSFKELLKNGENIFFLRYQTTLEQKEGYLPIADSALAASPNSRYRGSEPKIYSRYRYKYGRHLSLGFTAEKDAGEEFFKGSQKNGFDFYSAHLFIRNRGRIKQLAIGDYQAQFGQGLTYWSGRAFGKSADIMLIKRSAQGLTPYNSVDENRFLRGGGATFELGKFNITAFYSSNKIDATINDMDSLSGNNEQLVVTSLQQSGLHRTFNELESKDVVTQQKIGGHLAYKTRRLNIGLTGVTSKLDGDFSPNLRAYSQFSNASNKQTNLGVDYNWIYKNVNIFGEFSKSLNAGNAFVSGALIALDPKLSVAVLYRNYQRNFQPISSVGIGEGSTNQNEEGLYMGVVVKPIKKITLYAYFDQFTFPWLKYGVDAPSRGHQYLAQLTYKASKKMEMYIRIRERDKLENTAIDLTEGINYLVHEKQTNYRFNYSYKVSESIKLKGRVELVNYEKEESPFETGYLLFQDVVYKAKQSPFSFSFRYGLFDTESYNSRVYAYENDVLYAYSIPAYYNRGVRTYLTVKYSIVRGVDVWLRYGLTYYDNINVISSGLEEIQGNHKQEVKAQLRLRF